MGSSSTKVGAGSEFRSQSILDGQQKYQGRRRVRVQARVNIRWTAEVPS